MTAISQTYQTHPAAELFPMMEEQQIKEMADDIRLNGLREPITMCGGKVLDGRNRLKACARVGVEPSFVELPPGESPAAFVWSKNCARRHLTLHQRSMAAIQMQTMTAKESKERMSRGGTLAVRKGVEIIPQAEKGRTRDKLAEIAHVNPHYISDAKVIQDRSPELAAEVLAGNVTIPEAKRRLKGDDAKEIGAEQAIMQPIDAALLVVDLAIGTEDRGSRLDILRNIVKCSLAEVPRKTPVIILIKEQYREGVIQSYMPEYSATKIPDSWTELETKTNIISCQAFPLRCRRVKPKSSSSETNMECIASGLKFDLEGLIKHLSPKNAENTPGILIPKDNVDSISTDGDSLTTAQEYVDSGM